MNNKVLTILIVNFNTADFILNSLYCLKNLTKNNYQVFILDNGSKNSDYQKLKEGIKEYSKIFLKRKKTKLRGSLAHSTALNELVKNINTPYGVILDADCTFLIKNWDEILISQLKGKIKIIGTQAPVGTVKPEDFPLMFAILFESQTFKKLNLDFRPQKNRPDQDTGWQLREKYLQAGYRSKLLKMKNTRVYKQGPFKNVVCAEYYLKGISKIFASHFGRGSNPFAKNLSKIKMPIIKEFLTYLKWQKLKTKWLSTCRRIVEKQIK